MQEGQRPKTRGKRKETKAKEVKPPLKHAFIASALTCFRYNRSMNISIASVDVEKDIPVEESGMAILCTMNEQVSSITTSATSAASHDIA